MPPPAAGFPDGAGSPDATGSAVGPGGSVGVGSAAIGPGDPAPPVPSAPDPNANASAITPTMASPPTHTSGPRLGRTVGSNGLSDIGRSWIVQSPATGHASQHRS